MEGMIGEIRLFAGNFSPKAWTYCAGQTMAISSNTALFSILGTTYGGNGTTTFGIPDLRGRVAIGAGSGSGLTPRTLGEMGGAPTTTISLLQMPAHIHALSGGGTVALSGSATATMNVNQTLGDLGTPDGNYLGMDMSGNNIYNPSSGNPVGVMNSGAITVNTSGLTAELPTMQTSVTGVGIPFNNMQPYTGMSYILCMYGVFPPRN
jgi:microcystin-dependent protein